MLVKEVTGHLWGLCVNLLEKIDLWPVLLTPINLNPGIDM